MESEDSGACGHSTVLLSGVTTSCIRVLCNETSNSMTKTCEKRHDQTGDETTEPVWRLGLEVVASRDSPLRLLPLLTIRAWPWLTLATL
jgi:hypothetical protein